MSPAEYRIGQGLDVHQLAKGRTLVIGGVSIEHDRGLIGHSDADVLIHALIDALLGAAGKEDIGTFFPPSDARWKDADSAGLLQQIWRMLSGEGWRLVNLDSTVFAEAPRLAPHIARIKENLASALGVSAACCGVKAATFEKMGFVGRQEGIMASCVVLLSRGGL